MIRNANVQQVSNVVSRTGARTQEAFVDGRYSTQVKEVAGFLECVGGLVGNWIKMKAAKMETFNIGIGISLLNFVTELNKPVTEWTSENEAVLSALSLFFFHDFVTLSSQECTKILRSQRQQYATTWIKSTPKILWTQC